MLFLNRLAELDFLNQSGLPGLQILYGRRRVGKTELLREFAKSRRHGFYVATQSSSDAQLRDFSTAVRRGLGEEAQGVSFADWAGALAFLANRARQSPLLVVLDEFPYLVEANSSLPSLLQVAWDESLSHSQLLIVLCGSSISFMESEVLGHGSPLYGRRTGQFLVEPLGFAEANLFFPKSTAVERIELYATLGGMPAYLRQFDPGLDLWTNIQRKILQKGAFLHEEVPFLLMQELREPRLYLAILTAIAEGHTRLNEIAQRALGPAQVNRASFYLQTLQNLRLVERRVPVSESQVHKSRKGIYVLRDPFVRFWMRFVYPESSTLETGETESVVERIRAGWSDFVAPIFEEVCRRSLLSPGLAGRLPFRPWRIGSWWGPKGEIDVVALDSTRTQLLIGECKWSQQAVGSDVLDRLQQSGEILRQEMDIRQVHYALFSRTGFTSALTQRSEPILLLTPDDLH